MNLNNKKRINEDLVVYENFLTDEESAKIILALEKQEEKIDKLKNYFSQLFYITSFRIMIIYSK